YFDYEKWMKHLEENGIDYTFYTSRERDREEILPWDFIDVGVTKSFLWREYEQAKKETVTPNCRQRCAGCGAMSFGGGVCFESRKEAR
ncbi:MAG: B12-binding domain-containing radical SAM protein, partial [Acetivibrio ethanolgignens]